MMSGKHRREWDLPGKRGALFCDAVQSGGLLFTSGLTARGLDGEIRYPGDTAAQARVVFENLEAVLALTGSTFRDVVRMTVYLRNMEDRVALTPLREEFFAGARPASTVVEVSMLAHPDMMLEIEAVAEVGE